MAEVIYFISLRFMTKDRYAVALSSGTASLHLATKLAAERLYGKPKANQGAL